jgi:L-lactate dehydrogenase
VKKSGAKVIENKGATFYAVSMAVCHICKCLSVDAGTALTVSTMMHGEYGIEDVCLSTLVLVGPNGVQRRIEVSLTDEEVALLHKSADTLKDIISQLEI